MKITHNGQEGYFYKYEHAAITTDSVVFGFDGNGLHVLLIRRKSDTYDNEWAIPGGFLNMNETAEECARRELAEETNAANIFLKQFRVFSAVERDPRERVLTIAFLGLVRKADHAKVLGSSDASEAKWFPWKEAREMKLAFDHNMILNEAYEELKRQLRYTEMAFQLLDEKFTLADIQNICEIINGEQYDRRNFFKKMNSYDFIEKTGEQGEPIHNKRPDLYAFSQEKFDVEQSEGKKFPFDF